MIVFNEYEYVEEILKHGFISKRNLGFEMQLLATYYREYCKLSDKQIESELHLFCKLHIKEYNKIKFYQMIDNKVKRSKKLSLKIPKLINITQAELDLIMSEKDLKCQKLMFVYLVLAKYYMSINKSDKYYVGCKDADIFKLCNMYVKSQDKLELMHYLTKQGYIKPTLSMSSIINYVDEDSEVIMSFTPGSDMVYYFERYLGNLILECSSCGKLCRRYSNSQKYCKSCAEKIKNSVIQKP